MKTPSLLKPWTRLGISKKQYKALQPWKAAKMSRERYEKIILTVPQDVIDGFRREAEANALVEEIFGKDIAADNSE